MTAMNQATAAKTKEDLAEWRVRHPVGTLQLALTTWLSLPMIKQEKGPFGDLLSFLGEGLPPMFMGQAGLQQAASQESFKKSMDFMAGIQAYQHHPAVRKEAVDANVVWCRGTTKVRDYSEEVSENSPVILVVPSLINRFDILDLDEDQSLLRYLASQGLRPFVIDWGVPGDEEKSFGMADYVLQRLVPIFDFLSTRVAKGPPHVLGYCMGGTLSVALSVLRREEIRSLALMATPWEFGGVPMAEKIPSFVQGLEPFLAQFGCLPVDILQIMFAQIQPMQVVQKFLRFAELDGATEAARRFVLAEDWLNDGVPLSAPVTRECLLDWYGRNLTGRTEWKVGGQVIDPQLIRKPVYVIAPANDRIVPPQMARPLARLVPGGLLHEPQLGHIGLLAGRTAPKDVWVPLAHWFLGF